MKVILDVYPHEVKTITSVVKVELRGADLYIHQETHSGYLIDTYPISSIYSYVIED